MPARNTGPNGVIVEKNRKTTDLFIFVVLPTSANFDRRRGDIRDVFRSANRPYDNRPS